VPESKHRFVELNKPEDIAINDKTGKIFVTDTKNSRMQVFQLK
jgi:secreted PhoX family phosphatase